MAQGFEKTGRLEGLGLRGFRVGTDPTTPSGRRQLLNTPLFRYMLGGPPNSVIVVK